MSMQDGQGPQDAGTANEDDPNAGQGTEAPPVGENDSQPANPFLEAVDPNDRAVVEKYIKQWDANVTRRQMELQRQYEPYRNLGDVETLTKAQQLYDYFQRNPQEVYQKLHSAFGQQQQVPQPQLQPNVNSGQGFSGNEFPEDLAPYLTPLQQQFVQQRQEMQQFQQTTTQVLEALAGYVTNQQQTSQQAQEDAALDQQLNLLKAEFGDFDEEFVLAKMYAGVDPVEAVRAYKSKFQASINQQRTGPTLNGGGGTPPSGKSVQDLNQKETRALVADVLAKAAQAKG